MKFLLLLIFALCSFFANAQTYVTTQDLNVRKGASAKYEALGIILKGTTIEVLETTGSWGKINYQGTEGYISTKFLQEGSNINVSSTTNTSSGFSSTWKWILVALIVVLLFIFRNTTLIKLLFRAIGGIFRAVLPEATKNFSGSNSSNQKRQVYCSKCGVGKLGSVVRQDECPSGGQHNWRVL
ncbi:MAG: SH3 domain-containing protein [Chitinophagaceae bacterium]|nr:SH3 domain-containing protein [Chitinophagaceae bacterium]